MVAALTRFPELLRVVKIKPICEEFSIGLFKEIIRTHFSFSVNS